MAMLKIDVPHSLTKEEAKQRVTKLVDYWGGKYGVTTEWNGDKAHMKGKIMGINVDARLEVTDRGVGGEATDPGFLFREKAKKYIQEKVAAYLDPHKGGGDPGED